MTKETKTVKAVAVTILEGAALDKAIDSIKARGSKLSNDAHQAAVSILVHVEKSGDVRPAIRLIDALPELSRKNALRDWFINFGKLGYDAENKTMTYAKDKKIMLQDAKNTPFWKFQPEKAYVPFDMQKAVAALVAKAEKAMQRGDAVDVTQLNKLRAVTEAVA